MYCFGIRFSSLPVAFCTLLLSGPVLAFPLVGVSFSGPSGAVLYDVDPATGLASNPRMTSLDRVVGIAAASDGTLCGLTNSAAPVNPGSLFRIGPQTGAVELIGALGMTNILEGDLAVDPTTGTLYGLYNQDSSKRQLFSIDTTTGAGLVVPGSLFGDCSAMAFDGSGQLYVVDTGLHALLKVDKATGAVAGITSLSAALGSTAGMAVDPASGIFYVTDGGTGGTNMLYTLDLATGTLTARGPTGVPTGLAGLAFLPEPGCLAFWIAVSIVCFRRARPAMAAA